MVLDLLFFAAIASVLLAMATLLAGLFSLGRSEEFGLKYTKKYTKKIMRARVAPRSPTAIEIPTLAFMRSRGG